MSVPAGGGHHLSDRSQACISGHRLGDTAACNTGTTGNHWSRDYGFVQSLVLPGRDQCIRWNPHWLGAAVGGADLHHCLGASKKEISSSPQILRNLGAVPVRKTVI